MHTCAPFLISREIWSYVSAVVYLFVSKQWCFVLLYYRPTGQQDKGFGVFHGSLITTKLNFHKFISLHWRFSTDQNPESYLLRQQSTKILTM